MTKVPPPVKDEKIPHSAEFDRQISGLLQTMYGAVESEGIPIKFLDLLEKLDQAEREQSPSKDI